MRIDHLRVENFRGFETREFPFHPQFNLVVGINGSGKSSLLDALAVAAGSWFLGIRGVDSRSIQAKEVRLLPTPVDASGEDASSVLSWEQQWPCVVEARGWVLGRHLIWRRTLNSLGGRTTQQGAAELKQLAASADAQRDSVLPLIANFGTGRLWNMPPAQARVTSERDLPREEELGRRAGYRDSIVASLSASGLVRWIARQSWMTYQRGGEEPPAFSVVRQALVGCLEGARDLHFDASYGEVVIRMENQDIQPFNNLSDGQRTVLALVGDVATRAATLNPHLGADTLSQTPGVVLIDELDLHLHPKWQRHIIEDLRRTFPKIQFITTTHSPILIQSLRSGEELIVLDGQPTAAVANMSIAEIVRGIQGVSGPDVSARYEAMKDTARTYLETLDQAESAPREKLAFYKARLSQSIEPYADNPAFQAFLEMKRVARIGE